MSKEVDAIIASVKASADAHASSVAALADELKAAHLAVAALAEQLKASAAAVPPAA